MCSVDRLLTIAEETLAEFLSKATGTAVDWVQMPGMKVYFLLDLYFIAVLIVIPWNVLGLCDGLLNTSAWSGFSWDIGHIS